METETPTTARRVRVTFDALLVQATPQRTVVQLLDDSDPFMVPTRVLTEDRVDDLEAAPADVPPGCCPCGLPGCSDAPAYVNAAHNTGVRA